MGAEEKRAALIYYLRPTSRSDCTRPSGQHAVPGHGRPAVQTHVVVLSDGVPLTNIEEYEMLSTYEYFHVSV